MQQGGFGGQPPGGYPPPGQQHQHGAYPAAPQASGGQLGAGTGHPGAGPPAVHNPYAQAQAALQTGRATLKITMYAVGAIGVLCAVGGVLWLVMGSMGGGLGLLITGVVMVVTAMAMPKFMGQLSSATSMVDGLAARSQLAQTGVPATGHLVSVQQTGRMVNFNPEVAATVQVTHPNTGASYQVQTTAVVPQIAIPQFQPGAQVQVRINPHNPMDVAVVV